MILHTIYHEAKEDMATTPKISITSLKQKAGNWVQYIRSLYKRGHKLSENFPNDTASIAPPVHTNNLDFTTDDNGTTIRTLLTNFLTKYN